MSGSFCFSTYRLNMETRPIVVAGYLDLPHYLLREDGVVFTTRRGYRLLRAPVARKPMVNPGGYQTLTLYAPETGYTGHFIHRLVALVFIGPPPFPGAVVRHLDDSGAHGLAANNHYTNLAWGSTEENNADRLGKLVGEKSSRAVLSELQASEIKKRAVEGQRPYEIALSLGLSPGVVAGVYRGATWKHVPWPCSPERAQEIMSKKRKHLSLEEVEQIKTLLSQGLGPTELGKRFGVSKCTISAIKRGRNWSGELSAR